MARFLFALLLTISCGWPLIGCGDENNCTPNARTICKDGVTYWADSCGKQGDKAGDCECGCNAYFTACKTPCCLATPDCGNRECGLDPVCGTMSCGTCSEPTPDCNDQGQCESEANPKLEYFHVGTTSDTPVLADMAELPETDRISIDFGLVDAGTVNQRYLFLRNSGQGSLELLSLVPDPAISPDFFLGCRVDHGPFATDCALSIIPGSDLVIEVIYAPTEAGADSGSFTLSFNVNEHQTVIVDLLGEAVTPEIQVCFADCVGAESDPACAGADELCNGQVDRDQFVLAFGDADMENSIERVVTVRNSGQRALDVRGVVLGGYNSQFSVDLSGSGIPGDSPAK